MAANPFGAHQAGIGIAGWIKGVIGLYLTGGARHQWLWIAGAIWWRAPADSLAPEILTDSPGCMVG
jgi:hypothetical protein